MELEKEVKNPPNSAEESADLAEETNMTDANAGSSSDNESWTILDEDDQENDTLVTLNTRIDVIKSTAQFTKREINTPGVGNFESDSDIETIDEKHAENNLESLHSDGIPVGEELSEVGAQYLWSSETDLTTSSSTQTIKKVDSDEIDNEEEEDDLEIIDENDDKNVESRNTVDSLCPSGYPPEELMERFAEIVKGRTYLHRPNQSLNLYLTATLAIVIAMVIGLGFGHFKGWSERLELQEQFADVREERMEELTESLVTCMTGEEGRGGDDQDLDDLVIRQLRDENEKLRFELHMLKEVTDQDNSATAEMTVILRDRINDLLVANADLEKEVVKLKYTAPPVFVPERSQELIVEDTEELMETKESLNNMVHENDQLKLAIAKERYGPRQVPIEAKQKLNILQTENDELKTEVRKFRYGVSHQFTDEDLFDEAYNSTEEIFEDDDTTDNEDVESMVEDNEPNFVTLSRVQNKPILPPVIVMGGRLREAIEEDTTEDDDDDEGFVEDLVEDYEEIDHETMEEEETILDDDKVKEEDTTKETPDYFQSFTENVDMNKIAGDIGQIFSIFENNAKNMFNPDSKQMKKIKNGAEKLGNVFKEKWQEIEKNTKYFLPETDQKHIQKFRQSAEELGSVLKQKWNELDWIKEKDHLRNKLTKTISKALDKAKDVIEEDLIGDGQSWSQRLNKVQEKFQSKWQEVLSKFSPKEETDTCKETTKANVDVNNNKKKQKQAKKSNSKQTKPEKEIKAKKNYTTWSKKKVVKPSSENVTSDSSAAGATPSWVFERAKKRDAKRQENKKSDWLFERASSRKRFHNLLSESEWYNRRLYNKYCHDGDCTNIDQDTFHVKKGKKFAHRGETEPLKNRQGFKFANNFMDDDIKDEDDIKINKDDDKDDYIGVQKNFVKTQRRGSSGSRGDPKKSPDYKKENNNRRGFDAKKAFEKNREFLQSKDHSQRLNRKPHHPHRQNLVNFMHKMP